MSTIPEQGDRETRIWDLGARVLTLRRRPLIMGILNVTPDSFSDGGQHIDPDAAVKSAIQMEADGADIIDIGGESTRPYSTIVAADEELAPRDAGDREARPAIEHSDQHRHQQVASGCRGG